MRSVLWCLIGSLVAIPTVALGDDATARQVATDSEVVAALEPLIEKPVEANFNDTPLEEMIASLSEQIGETIWIDENGLDEEGFKRTTPVTLTLMGKRPLRHVSNRLMDDFTLLIYPSAHHELLILTSEIDSRLDTYIHIHDVTGFAEAGFLEREPAAPGGDQPVPEHDRKYDADGLIDLIEFVTYGPWESQQGAGSHIDPVVSSQQALLVVHAPYETHREVDRLLSHLRLACHLPTPAVAGEASAAKLEALLNVPVEANFDDVPLVEAVASLGEQIGTRIEINRSAVKDEGVELDERLTLKLKRPRPLAQVSRLLLEDIGLTLVASRRYDTLMVTSLSEAEFHPRARVYDVTDLGEAGFLRRQRTMSTGDEAATGPNGFFAVPSEPSQMSKPAEKTGADGTVVTMPDSDEPPATEPRDRKYDASPLMVLIQNHTTAAWEATDSETAHIDQFVSPRQAMLVMWATDEVHGEADRLLTDLRRAIAARNAHGEPRSGPSGREAPTATPRAD